jgi:hypothetical protein
VFRGWEVPEVLRNGDHARIERWRRTMALRRTLDERPDLIEARGGLSDEEQVLLAAADQVRAPVEGPETDPDPDAAAAGHPPGSASEPDTADPHN